MIARYGKNAVLSPQLSKRLNVGETRFWPAINHIPGNHNHIRIELTGAGNNILYPASRQQSAGVQIRQLNYPVTFKTGDRLLSVTSIFFTSEPLYHFSGQRCKHGRQNRQDKTRKAYAISSGVLIPVGVISRIGHAVLTGLP